MPVANTSKEAYSKVDKEAQRARIYKFLKKHPRRIGWTNREIAEELDMEHSTVAARRNALAARGLVEPLESSRHHKIKNWQKYAKATPVVAI
jgi:DNA-binding transcriptional ArsR family regulator